MVLVALAVGAVTDRLTLSRDESKVLEFIDNIRNKQVSYPPSALCKNKSALPTHVHKVPGRPCPALPVAAIIDGGWGWGSKAPDGALRVELVCDTRACASWCVTSFVCGSRSAR